MTQVLPYILIIAVLVLGVWLIQHTMYSNEEKKRQFELKRESQKTISPIRLRAYERLTLLLERTTPEHMLMELRSKEPEALVSWSIGQVQQYLLQTIRIEFEHNMSQQVYVSEEVWTLIMNARDQMAAFVIAASTQLPPNATAQTYATTLITAYKSNGETPSDKALAVLKEEVQTIL